MKKVVTFGEIMLRLNPKGYLRFTQAVEFEASYAGAEANVAVSLANFGIDAAFVTKVPAHDMGQCAVNELRRFGVDVSNIIRGGDRLGAYYVEKGASQRASKVIYDRAYSAIASVKPGEFDWNAILKPAGSSGAASWFHFTGITPALGDGTAAVTMEAVKAAKALGLTVSCDLNYRKNLWPKEKAGKVMGELMPYVDICIANEEDTDDVFGIRAEGTDINKGQLDKDGYCSVAKKLAERWPFKKIAFTLRGSISASDNEWSGMLYDNSGGGAAFFSPVYNVRIVDRVGGGDSFGAALIYAQLSGYDNQKSIDFAAAASCLKHSIEHDFNLVNVAEITSLAGGNASGRVQR